MLAWSLFFVLAFLFGSIPFGLLIARARGVDIRKHGSGNIGATNVWRVLGRGPGLLCFALDVLKGLIPTLAAGWWMGLLSRHPVPGPIDARDAWLWLAIVAAAMLGHMFTPWAGFKGGKGVATGLGAILGVYPFLTVPGLGALAIWIFAAARWRYVSLASCLAAGALPLLVLGWAALGSAPADAWPFVGATAALGTLVIAKHRANLRRLLAGTENRIGHRAPVDPVP
jgi:acyl phosphate:glycerol-3-phosphate acyltransferase